MRPDIREAQRININSSRDYEIRFSYPAWGTEFLGNKSE